MKIVALVENTTISPKYKKKHGLCIYVETKRHKILFDVGPSDLFLKNAKKMQCDIASIDIVIISHGHTDHGGALKEFLNYNSIAKIYIQESAFLQYYTDVFGFKFPIGLDNSLKDNDRIVFVGNEFWIDEELYLFSNVNGKNMLSESNKKLYVKKGNKYEQDRFSHEQNMIIRENGKFVLFGGCAHNGIVNILEKAEELCDCEMDCAISGFHLFNPVSKKSESEGLILKIADILSKKKTQYYTCHCTGKKPFRILQNKMREKIKYLSTGASVEFF